MEFVSKTIATLLFIAAAIADLVLSIWDIQAFFDLADVSIVNLSFRIVLSTAIVCALFFAGIGLDCVLTKGEGFPELKGRIFENGWWGVIVLAPTGTHILFGGLKLISEVFSFVTRIF